VAAGMRGVEQTKGACLRFCITTDTTEPFRPFRGEAEEGLPTPEAEARHRKAARRGRAPHPRPTQSSAPGPGAGGMASLVVGGGSGHKPLFTKPFALLLV